MIMLEQVQKRRLWPVRDDPVCPDPGTKQDHQATSQREGGTGKGPASPAPCSGHSLAATQTGLLGRDWCTGRAHQVTSEIPSETLKKRQTTKSREPLTGPGFSNSVLKCSAYEASIGLAASAASRRARSPAPFASTLRSTSSTTAIGALSPRRKPALRTRV